MPDNGTIELAGALNGTLDLEGELNGLIQVPKDGYSPTVTVTDITGGHRITITDEDGDHTYDVMDGVDGADGGTPTVVKENVYQSWSGPAGSSLSSERTGFYLTITDAEGNETATGNIMEAWPVLIKASKSGGVTTVKFYTDSSTEDATLTINDGQDGADGQDGPQGPAGVGVPTGGTTGQVLKKKSGTNYDTEWANESGGGGDDNVFVAIYGTTTYAEVMSAFTDGKAIFCLIEELDESSSLLPMADHGVEFGSEPFTFSVTIGEASVLFAYLYDEEYIEDSWASEVFFFRDKLVPTGGTTDQVLAKVSNANNVYYWRTISTPPSPATATPSDLGTAAVGSSSKYAKEDHVHKMPSASDVGAYALPSGGIPATDLASAVQTSLGKADTALQSYTETDPTVPAWAKASSKPSYTASEVGAILEPATADAGDVLTWDGLAWVADEVSTATDAQVQNAVDDYLDEHPATVGTFTNAAKSALLALLRKVAYVDKHGQTYLDTLESLLFSVDVDSISAVFTQGSATIYDTDSLDSLKQYLVVTATWSDSTTSTVPSSDYTLIGTLTVGTSTITASYGGKTDTFTVAVTEYKAYPFVSGSKQFSDGSTVTVSNGNHVKYECKTTFSSSGNSNPFFNISDVTKITTTDLNNADSVNNQAKVFSFSSGDSIVFSIDNVEATGSNAYLIKSNFRIANTGNSYSGTALSVSSASGASVTKTGTDVNISCAFLFFEKCTANAVYEFDVHLTVNGTKYF